MKKVKTLFTILALTVTTLTAWADGTISIPQADAGTYIPIGTIPATSGDKTPASGITLTGCQVDGNYESEAYTSYTVGSTNGSPMSIQFALTAAAGNYLFSFKSGHSQGTATVSLSLKNSSNEEIWNNGGNNVDISNTGSWTPTVPHTFLIGDLEDGSYTMTITGVSKSGSYYGNFGNFCFHNETSLTMPYDESHLLNVNMGTASGASLGGNYLNGIQVNGYVDDVYMYVSQESYYSVYAGYGYATAGTDNFTITITDVSTSTAEVNAKNYTVTDSRGYVMTDKITAGWKKLRLDHPGPTITTSFRLEKMYFTKIDNLPLTNEATLNLNQATANFVGGCKYESGNSNIGYVKHGSYADNYYVYNNNETAYYTLHAGIPWYKKGGTFTITITDVATGTADATTTSSTITGTGEVEFTIPNAISRGMKKIRFDFTNEGESDYLFNLNNVSFEKRIASATIGATGWASFSSTEALDFTGTGVTAYIAKEKDASSVSLTSIAKVPAETGIVLNATPDTYEIPVLVGDADATTGNLLKANLVDYTLPASQVINSTTYYNYTLAYESSSPVFKHSTGNGTLAAGKAYLQITTNVTQAPTLRFEFEEEDNATDLERFKVQESGFKFIENGKLFILRNGITYDALGRIVR